MLMEKVKSIFKPKKIHEPNHTEVHPLPSGIKISDLKTGEGKEAVHEKAVVVHYKGWLDNNGTPGKEFDSSYKRNQPFSFQIGRGQVIKGWEEGVLGMREGGKRWLWIPSYLAYGEQGAGDAIPANADLIFEVELLEVR